MILTLVLDRESRTFSQVADVDAIGGLCSNASKIVWVDVSDPTSLDFENLARQFGFHPLSIEDCRHQHQRPKVEEFPGYYFIVLYEAVLNDQGRLQLGELGIFLGKNYLVTVHSEPIRAIETAERLWRSWTDLAERGTGLLAYLLIDAVVDDYLPLLDEVSDRMDSLEAGGRWLRESLAVRQTHFPKGHWLIASSESILGEHLVLERKFAEAEQRLLSSEQKLVAARGEEAPVIQDARTRLVKLYEAWGKADQAARWRDVT